MSTIRYNKLVRDRIPEIISNSDKRCVCRTLSDDEYIMMLDAKLNEEFEYTAARVLNSAGRSARSGAEYSPRDPVVAGLLMLCRFARSMEISSKRLFSFATSAPRLPLSRARRWGRDVSDWPGKPATGRTWGSRGEEKGDTP